MVGEIRTKFKKKLTENFQNLTELEGEGVGGAGGLHALETRDFRYCADVFLHTFSTKPTARDNATRARTHIHTPISSYISKHNNEIQ